jgi:hypothetical protein
MTDKNSIIYSIDKEYDNIRKKIRKKENIKKEIRKKRK